MAESGPREEPRPRIQSAVRTVDIITAIAQNPAGLSAQDVAETLDIPLQTIYRLLRPLGGAQIVHRAAGGRYVLGPGAQILAKGLARQYEHIDFSLFLEALSGSTRESAHVAGWANGAIVVHAAVRGWPVNDLVDIATGPYRSAHARAGGKLLLAFADPALRDDYLIRFPSDPVTARTLTDSTSLAEEFELIRKQAYAVELEEFAGGVCGLSVLIQAAGGDFAMGLSVPAERFHADFPALLASARKYAAKAAQSIIT